MRAVSILATTFLALSSGTARSQFVVETDPGQWSRSPRGGTLIHVYGYSDCSSENAMGLAAGGEIAWFQGFDTADKGCSFDDIYWIGSANGMWGSTHGAPAYPFSSGGYFVYDDPGGDATDPTDLRGADLRYSASWRTCCPNDDYKEAHLVSASVSEGFWFAAMLSHDPGEFPAPMDTTTAPSNGRTWVTGSNTSFDPTEPGAGLGFVEMASVGFDCHWLVSARGFGCGPPAYYCTAKTDLVCGPPSIDFYGLPGAGSPAPFVIGANWVRSQTFGTLLYSCEGPAAIPFDGGYLCVAAPVRRTPPVNSSGSSPCSGVWLMDFNRFANGLGGGQPDPCVQQPGQLVNWQWWGRDSPTTGSVLTGGLQLNM